LIFNLYDVNEGSIKVNNGETCATSSLNRCGRTSPLSRRMCNSSAPSIRENLTFFDRSIPDEKIIATLEDLELGDWFRTLPNGLDTELETGSRSLSAGEAQLLAFTRVFLRNPGLVILDEASSRLDPATEQKLEHAIDKLLKDAPPSSSPTDLTRSTAPMTCSSSITAPCSNTVTAKNWQPTRTRKVLSIAANGFGRSIGLTRPLTTDH
jgi:ABC-type multidrug transport system fused ATPase/permease subunit